MYGTVRYRYLTDRVPVFSTIEILKFSSFSDEFQNKKFVKISKCNNILYPHRSILYHILYSSFTTGIYLRT